MKEAENRLEMNGQLGFEHLYHVHCKGKARFEPVVLLKLRVCFHLTWFGTAPYFRKTTPVINRAVFTSFTDMPDIFSQKVCFALILAIWVYRRNLAAPGCLHLHGKTVFSCGELFTHSKNFFGNPRAPLWNAQLFRFKCRQKYTLFPLIFPFYRKLKLYYYIWWRILTSFSR